MRLPRPFAPTQADWRLSETALVRALARQPLNENDKIGALWDILESARNPEQKVKAIARKLGLTLTKKKRGQKIHWGYTLGLIQRHLEAEEWKKVSARIEAQELAEQRALDQAAYRKLLGRRDVDEVAAAPAPQADQPADEQPMDEGSTTEAIALPLWERAEPINHGQGEKGKKRRRKRGKTGALRHDDEPELDIFK